MGVASAGWIDRGIGRVIAFVDGSERRRVAVVVGVSILFLLSVLATVGQHLGLLPFGLAVALALYLYTRSSPRSVVAASAAGPGVLALGLYVVQVYRTVATASTEPVVTTLVRSSGWLVVGLVLVGLGTWVRRREF